MNQRTVFHPHERDHIALVSWRIVGSITLGALWIWTLWGVA